MTNPIRPVLRKQGNGTIDDCDIFVCPACHADMTAGWDEVSDGSIVGDGTYSCVNHHVIDPDGGIDDYTEGIECGNNHVDPLVRVKLYFESEQSPLFAIYEDGDWGQFDGCEMSFGECVTSLRETGDNTYLDQYERDEFKLYRQIVDALSPDEGAARRANHVTHLWSEDDPHAVCSVCKEPQNEDCGEWDCRDCYPRTKEEEDEDRAMENAISGEPQL